MTNKFIQPKYNRCKLIGLLIIFILPLIAAGILFYGYNYFHFSRLNHGQLITPPITLSTNIYEQLNQSDSRHRWLIIQTVTQCDMQCQQIHQQLLQVQKALGNNRERIAVLQVTEMPSPLLSTQRIYLVDPMGNVFMVYPLLVDPLNILQDLKKLLEVSQIG